MAASGAAPSTAEPPAKHAPTCDCGCVPDVISLFEQARIRKAKKEAQAPPVEQAELCDTDESDADDDAIAAALLAARRRRAEPSTDAPKQVEQR